MTTIICEWCKTMVHHEPRRISGCNCDPDAPQWCYIDQHGNPRGLGSARYTTITEGNSNEEKGISETP